MFPFDWFFLVFFVAFFMILGLTGFIFLRILRRPSAPQTPQEKPSVIVKEIVKIRCPYCNTLYDEKTDNCPHCGGTRKN